MQPDRSRRKRRNRDIGIEDQQIPEKVEFCHWNPIQTVVSKFTEHKTSSWHAVISCEGHHTVASPFPFCHGQMLSILPLYNIRAYDIWKFESISGAFELLSTWSD